MLAAIDAAVQHVITNWSFPLPLALSGEGVTASQASSAEQKTSS